MKKDGVVSIELYYHRETNKAGKFDVVEKEKSKYRLMQRATSYLILE